MFNPSTFKLAPLPSWQYSYRLMFSQERGKVNVPFETCVEHAYWGIPQGSKTPKDWDLIIEGYYLAVSSKGRLNVDDGTVDVPNLITSATGEDGRTLYHCFIAAFQDYAHVHGRQHEKLHPSWYEVVANFVVK